MPSNRKQRDLKATSLIVGGSSASTTSEIMGGGTYVKRDKPGNVQSKKYFPRLYLSISQRSGQCNTLGQLHTQIFFSPHYKVLYHPCLVLLTIQGLNFFLFFYSNYTAYNTMKTLNYCVIALKQPKLLNYKYSH